MGITTMNRLKYGEEILNNTKVIPMSQQTQEVVTNVGYKIGAIWLGIGVSSWSEAAAFFAAVLSFLALAEWVWKKALRPSFVYFGYAKPIRRKVKMVEVDDE
jgi:hypothetical protein